jgi:Tol biopolymer transport system component
VAILWTLWLAAPSLAANDRVVYTKNQTLWSADANGANQEQITESGTEHRVLTADLSPNGQTAVADGAGQMYIIDVDTHASRTIYTESGPMGFPKFSSDGKKIIFQTGSGDIATINTDGTGFTKVITWKGLQRSPDFSHDGTKIVFDSTTNSRGQTLTGGEQVFVANANGTSPVQVTNDTAGVVSGSFEGVFSPSGTSLAFTGLTSSGERVYTVSTSGTNQTQITVNNGGAPDWSPDGSLLLFGTNRNKGGGNYDLYTVRSTGGNEQPFITDPTYSLEAGWYRHPSTTVHFFDYLAARFEPVLRFDTSETWRPLNIESFFAEDQHHLCENERAKRPRSQAPPI